MIKHKLFLRWWLAFAGILIGLTTFTFSGGWIELYDKDATKLSFVIITIFLVMSQWCGYKTWLLSRFLDRGKKIEDEHMIREVENTMEMILSISFSLEEARRHSLFGSCIAISSTIFRTSHREK